MNSRGRYADPQDVVDLVHIERALKARGVEDVDEGVLWAVADLAHHEVAGMCDALHAERGMTGNSNSAEEDRRLQRIAQLRRPSEWEQVTDYVCDRSAGSYPGTPLPSLPVPGALEPMPGLGFNFALRRREQGGPKGFTAQEGEAAQGGPAAASGPTRKPEGGTVAPFSLAQRAK